MILSMLKYKTKWYASLRCYITILLSVIFVIPVVASEQYEFELSNAEGELINQNHWPGKYLLVNFGYTHCPDVCPMTLWHLTNALNLLGDDADKIKPVFISIDPFRDTPQHIEKYAKNFHPSIAALTGDREQIAKVAKSFRVVYGYKVKGRHIQYPVDSDYEVYHTAHIYLLSPKHELVELIGYGMDGQAMASRIKAVIGH